MHSHCPAVCACTHPAHCADSRRAYYSACHGDPYTQAGSDDDINLCADTNRYSITNAHADANGNTFNQCDGYGYFNEYAGSDKNTGTQTHCPIISS